MTKITSLFVATVLALSAAGIVHAAAENVSTPSDGMEKGRHMRPPSHHPMPLHAIFKKLSLTDTQKKQMRDIERQEIHNMPPPSEDERREMHAVIAADSFDKSKAETLADKMAANGKEKALSMLEMQNKMYNVLTDTQKKQFNVLSEKQLSEKIGQ